LATLPFLFKDIYFNNISLLGNQQNLHGGFTAKICLQVYKNQQNKNYLRSFFWPVKLGLPAKGVSIIILIFWQGDVRPANTCVPLCFFGNAPAQPWGLQTHTFTAEFGNTCGVSKNNLDQF